MSLLSYFRGRRGGKTTFAIDLVRKNPNAVLLVLNEEHARLARHQGVMYRQIVTFSQVQHGGLRGREHGPIVIDNFEYLLHDLLGIAPGTDVILTATGTNL